MAEAGTQGVQVQEPCPRLECSGTPCFMCHISGLHSMLEPRSLPAEAGPSAEAGSSCLLGHWLLRPLDSTPLQPWCPWSPDTLTSSELAPGAVPTPVIVSSSVVQSRHRFLPEIFPHLLCDFSFMAIHITHFSAGLLMLSEYPPLCYILHRGTTTLDLY